MRAGVPAGPVHTVPQALAQEHAAHRGMLVEDGDYRGIGMPVRLSQSCARPARKPPRFGEHAAEVLAEAGCTEEQISQLRRTGVVRDRPAR
jgi:crotonobetainyl-CoA:carnitine CoA-transferase CaiB-like acyl-CoA transferase